MNDVRNTLQDFRAPPLSMPKSHNLPPLVKNWKSPCCLRADIICECPQGREVGLEGRILHRLLIGVARKKEKVGRAAGQRKGSAGLILKNWNRVEGMIARAALPILASMLNLPPTLLVWSCILNRNRILQATHPKL